MSNNAYPPQNWEQNKPLNIGVSQKAGSLGSKTLFISLVYSVTEDNRVFLLSWKLNFSDINNLENSFHDTLGTRLCSSSTQNSNNNYRLVLREYSSR